MIGIDALIAQVDDKGLRDQLMREKSRLLKEKKFGLLFEEHIPELTPVYNSKIHRNCLVALKDQPLTDIWLVLKIASNLAHCLNRESGDTQQIPLSELVEVRQLGAPIFPALTSVARVQNSNNDSPWHTLIEAENYYALQLLEYLYTDKVDCIYIDPPYNSGGQKDWKYNNNYVDLSDNWRHSKWLAMMQRRLKLAKTLLKPDGVLIIAIDENEHAHLICLLESEFSDYEITSISVIHNPRGNRKNNFTIIHEYAVHVIKKGVSTIAKLPSENLNPRKLRRWGHYSTRKERPLSFYPIYVKDNKIIKIGQIPDAEFHPINKNIRKADGIIEIWPIDDEGIERRWNYGKETIETHLDRIVVLPKNDGNLDLFVVKELSQPKSVWSDPELDAGGKYGSTLVETVTQRKFPYPKSLYTVLRALDNVVQNKPDALILDFFAGSGTTLHATNLINKRDNGSRRCILVTNNEVSVDEANCYRKQGLLPGDQNWEKHGICQSITWPRSKYTILGRRDDGSELEDEYLTGNLIEKEIPRKFQQISFTTLSELTTSLQKKQLVALIKEIPQNEVKKDSAYIVTKQHSASILFDESNVDSWVDALKGQDHITNFYVVTRNKNFFNNLKHQITNLLDPVISVEKEKCAMKEGFNANLEYFRLEFLDKDYVALGRQFQEILPILWLQAGAIGPRPEISNNKVSDMLLPRYNPFAVLINEASFPNFLEAIKAKNDLSHIYLITDSTESFQEMTSQLPNPNVKVIQLYKDYLENFMINKSEI